MTPSREAGDWQLQPYRTNTFGTSETRSERGVSSHLYDVKPNFLGGQGGVKAGTNQRAPSRVLCAEVRERSGTQRYAIVRDRSVRVVVLEDLRLNDGSRARGDRLIHIGRDVRITASRGAAKRGSDFSRQARRLPVFPIGYVYRSLDV